MVAFILLLMSVAFQVSTNYILKIAGEVSVLGRGETGILVSALMIFKMWSEVLALRSDGYWMAWCEMLSSVSRFSLMINDLMSVPRPVWKWDFKIYLSRWIYILTLLSWSLRKIVCIVAVVSDRGHRGTLYPLKHFVVRSIICTSRKIETKLKNYTARW